MDIISSCTLLTIYSWTISLSKDFLKVSQKKANEGEKGGKGTWRVIQSPRARRWHRGAARLLSGPWSVLKPLPVSPPQSRRTVHGQHSCYPLTIKTSFRRNLRKWLTSLPVCGWPWPQMCRYLSPYIDFYSLTDKFKVWRQISRVRACVCVRN